MLRNIKNTFKMSIEDLWQIAAFIGGGWLMGFIITIVISFFTSPKNIFITGGPIIALMTAIMIIVMVAASKFWIDFEQGIKMGATRKALIVSQMCLVISQILVAIITLAAVFMADILIVDFLFTSKGIYALSEIDVVFVLKCVGIVVLLILSFGMFFGSMGQRYGKNAIAVIYVISMIAVVGVAAMPRLMKMNGVVGKAAMSIAAFVESIGVQGILIAIIIVSIVIIMFSILLLRRASIKV